MPIARPLKDWTNPASFLLLIVLGLLNSATSAASLTLAWDKSPESSVIGYNVYRASGTGGLRKINTAPVSDTRFKDSEVTAGQRYRYAVTAVSGSGLESKFSNEVDALVPVPESKVTAAAGADQVTREGDYVTLNGQGADSAGASLNYNWMQLTGPALSLTSGSLNQPSFTFRVIGIDDDAVLRFRLTVSNAQGTRAEDEVEVAVQNNRLPQISVVPSVSIMSGSVAKLSATASDPEGASVSINWEQLSGPQVTLSVPSAGSVTFTAPTVSQNTELTFQVSASDGIETSTRVVTATVLLERSRLLFPAAVQESAESPRHFLGFSIFNPESWNDSVFIQLIDAGGAEIETVSKSLNGQGQTAFLLNEISTKSQTRPKAVTVFGDQATIQGFFMAGTWSQDALDGIGAQFDQASTLFLPVASHAVAPYSTIFIANRSSLTDTQVTLALYSSSGSRLALTTIDLASQASTVLRLAETFSMPVPEASYIKLSSGAPISAMAFTLSEKAISTTAARSARELTRAIVPHFLVDSDNSTTSVSLLNTSSRSARPVIKVFDPTGSLLGESAIGLPARNRKEIDLRDVISAPSGLVTGQVQIDFGTASQVLTDVTFSINRGEAQATLPAPRELLNTLFLHTAQSRNLRIFTGLALANPGGSPCQVTVQVKDSSGNLTASQKLHLQPGERYISLLNDLGLFGKQFEQIGGHIRIESTSPIVSMALFGDLDSKYISAIEGQEPQAD